MGQTLEKGKKDTGKIAEKPDFSSKNAFKKGCPPPSSLPLKPTNVFTCIFLP
jgi:hypothetical protein